MEFHFVAKLMPLFCSIHPSIPFEGAENSRLAGIAKEVDKPIIDDEDGIHEAKVVSEDRDGLAGLDIWKGSAHKTEEIVRVRKGLVPPKRRIVVRRKPAAPKD
jgi:hypothetical protein